MASPETLRVRLHSNWEGTLADQSFWISFSPRAGCKGPGCTEGLPWAQPHLWVLLLADLRVRLGVSILGVPGEQAGPSADVGTPFELGPGACTGPVAVRTCCPPTHLPVIPARPRAPHSG